MRTFLSPICVLLAVFCLSGCAKNVQETERSVPAPPSFQLSYGDSVLFLKEGGPSTVYPAVARTGRYESYPDGLKMDKKTGAINLKESDAGLRYRIVFRGNDGARGTTTLLLSGINYPDRYFFLSKGDSLVAPLYNSDPSAPLPVKGGTQFDESRQASELGCSVQPEDGMINLARSVRNGLFGSTPKNKTEIDVPISYRLADDSDQSLKKVSVRLYYYNTVNDVPDYLKKLLQERQTMEQQLFSPVFSGDPARLTLAKPRPPCVIVIAR
ncbi:MAG TPA: hypothetical protein VHK69_19760 [Chitinophagaceae bacterium]|jgi:hypothetical protein|nr:hypothetical protein [Chitinophagaceae bacterium]